MSTKFILIVLAICISLHVIQVVESQSFYFYKGSGKGGGGGHFFKKRGGHCNSQADCIVGDFCTSGKCV